MSDIISEQTEIKEVENSTVPETAVFVEPETGQSETLIDIANSMVANTISQNEHTIEEINSAILESGLISEIQNLSWVDVCAKYHDLIIKTVDSTTISQDSELSEEQILLKTTGDPYSLFITHPSITIPILDSALRSPNIRLLGSGVVVTSWIPHRDENNNLFNLKLISYVPFDVKKDKIFAIMRDNAVFFCGSVKPQNSIPVTIYPPEPRDSDDRLIDVDYVNISARATNKKRFEGLRTVYGLMAETLDSLSAIKDPNYMIKLLNLNRSICYPDNVVVEETPTETEVIENNENI